MFSASRMIADTARRWAFCPISARHHIFIVGAPRSGTTLLKTLLVTHPRLAGNIYESTGLFKMRDLKRFRIETYTPEQLSQLLSENRDIVTLYDKITQNILNQAAAHRFVDKIWVRPHRLRFVVKHFPNARFIHIFRDGRDCYCSAQKHPHIPQRRSIQIFARYWRSVLRCIERTIPAEQLHWVSYERLTSAPADALTDAMKFVGEEFHRGQVDRDTFVKQATMRHVDFHKRLSQEIDSRSCARWCQELTGSEVAKFNAIAGDWLVKLGYPLVPQ